MADQEPNRRRRRVPTKVERRTTAATDQTVHEKRMEEIEKARFVAAPTAQRKRLPRGQMGQAAGVGAESGRGGGSSVNRMLTAAADTAEKTGFDILQLTYGEDVHPTTLPEPGKTDARLRMASYGEVIHVDESNPLFDTAGRRERRYCELLESDKGLFFVHKLRPSKSEPGRRVPMANSVVVAKEEDARTLVLRNGPHTVYVTFEDEEAAKLWEEMLTHFAQVDEELKDFAEHLENTYGTGLDFLAEAEREARVRAENNKELFGIGGGKDGAGSVLSDLREDELFLIQLPHRLPSAVGAAQRTAGGGAGGAGGKVDETKHKPGSGWTGRVLGSGDYPSSLRTFPSGSVGKIQVHKSGKIKMKMGECTFDVSSGGQASYAQTLMAVYSAETKYRASGWGQQGSPVYRTASVSQPTGLKKLDGEVISVSQEKATNEGYFFKIAENEWVL
eukprot:Rhum_TRINITY_DN15627_c0_g1::Rhum_TRINITY_DN15627_c0_g1_i1::g.161713::m.161713